MARQFVNTLTDALVDEVYLLADRQLRANRNADLYLLAQLRDKTGQVGASSGTSPKDRSLTCSPASTSASAERPSSTRETFRSS